MEYFQASIIGEQVAGILPKKPFPGSVGMRISGFPVVFPQLLDDAGELAHGSAQNFVRTARLMISCLPASLYKKNGDG
jgi:hypothetical protein